jgi:penicillin-binding protein 1A
MAKKPRKISSRDKRVRGTGGGAAPTKRPPGKPVKKTVGKKTVAKKTVAKKTTGRRSSTARNAPANGKAAARQTNTVTRTPNKDAPSGTLTKRKTPKTSSQKKSNKNSASGRARPSAAGGRARVAAKNPAAKRSANSKVSATTHKKAATSGQINRLRRPRMTPLTAFDIFLRRVSIFGVAASAVMIIVFVARLPSLDNLEIAKATPSITLLDVRGQTITTRGLSRGQSVDVGDLPPYVSQAVIAIEDRRFYSHFGIDPIGLARASYVNLKAGRVVQGGSTITQQLAKNVFLTPQRTWRRKFREMALALWLEAKFTKDEILTLYLNRVYMGAGTYGIEAASQRYFAKSAQQLTLPEAALLAGLLKAPSRYSPTNSMDRAKARSEVVLVAMVDAGLLTEDERFTANRRVTRLAEPAATPGAHYFADWVVEQVPDFAGTAGENLIVETTLDLTFQRAAEIALTFALERDGEAVQAGEGAVIALDLEGGVRALVGGRSYQRSQFNRATIAQRQPGSAFKPFVYLAALERGWSPQDIIVDEPIKIGSWSPSNYKDEYAGEVTLTTALAKSINTVAVRLGNEVGPKSVIETAKRVGLHGHLEPVSSLPLGTGEVTPINLAAAYVPFANGGRGVFVHGIKRIRTADGEIIFERRGSGPGVVIDPRNVGRMNTMLRAAVEEGTGRRARLANGRPMAGKTGTSQDFRDAWFVGYTANMVAAVWVGNDDGAAMKKVTGGTLPAAIWKDFMTRAGDNGPLWDLPGMGGLYENVEFVAEANIEEAAPFDELSSGAKQTSGKDEREQGGFFTKLARFLSGD